MFQTSLTMLTIRSAHMSRTIILAYALIFTALGCSKETYQRPNGEGTHILVDLYHTRLQNPEDHRLKKGDYAYQGVHGYARLFDHLKANGYPWQSLRESRLSTPRLDGFDILFINLLQESRPDFTPEEIKAITDFVEDGKGLFIIADHTNVYRHAERINKILKPMGIEITYHSALDYAPHSVSGIGWIAISNLETHPTNEGVDMISFQTGGTLLSDGATARTSEQGFGDWWDETNTGGFYGNWRYDGNDTDDDANDIELEPRGNVPVVAAVTYGKGRVVVVGDQNIYGDSWLHFGDNFLHALNVFEWLGKNELSDLHLRFTQPTGFNVGIDIQHNAYAPGDSSPDNYYTFFVNFNRDPDVTGRGILRLDHLDDALILPSPTRSFDATELDDILTYLKQGKRVVLLMDAKLLAPSAPQSNSRYRATIELIHELAPEFSLEDSNKTTISFAQEISSIETELANAKLERVPEVKTLFSDLIDTSNLSVARYSKKVKEDQTIYTPDMLKVTSSWGEPLLDTSDGYTIARRKKVDKGELIIFLQDGFWRNRTMGNNEAAPPPKEGLSSVELQYRFIDYLKTNTL